MSEECGVKIKHTEENKKYKKWVEQTKLIYKNMKNWPRKLDSIHASMTKGTFNRYVTLKGGRGVIHFVTERYWRGMGVQVIPLRNADKISQLVFI